MDLTLLFAALSRSAAGGDVRARVGTVTVAVMLGACAPVAPDDTAAVVTDSAGIRTLTYDLGTVDIAVFRTVGEHDLEIGTLDGPSAYTFSRIVDLAVLDSDALLISDAASRELRVFDRAGRHLGSFGGAGDGPGEFAAAPRIAGVAADSVFAFTSRAGRVTSFAPGGGVVESIALRRDEGTGVTRLLRTANGNYLAVSAWTAPGRPTEFHEMRVLQDSVVVERLDPLGSVVDTLAVASDRRVARVVQDRGEGRINVMQAEIMHSPRSVVETDGRWVVVGHTATFEFEIGALVEPRAEAAGPLTGATRVRVLGLDHPADGAAIRRYEEDAYRTATGNETVDPRTGSLFDLLPDRLPAVFDLVVGADGDVWVAKAAFDRAEGLDWLVFSSEGRLRGSVRTPPDVRLLAVERDYVVGVVHDELEVPYVRRYPLVVVGR